MKKGQITIFIILGLMLLLLVGISLYISQRTSRAQVEAAKLISLEPGTVTEYVQNCMSLVGEEGVYRIAEHGGYLNPLGDPRYGESGDYKRLHFSTEDGPAPYLLDGKKPVLRPLNEISGVLSNYIAVELKNCLDFSSFESQGWTVQQPTIDWPAIGFDSNKALVPYSAQSVKISVTPRLEAGDIVLSATYPLSFTRGSQQFSVYQFSTTLPLRLALLHRIAERLIGSMARNEDAYNLQQHCSEYAAQDKLINIYTTLAPYDFDHAVRIVDAQPTNQGKAPLRFQFGVINVNLAGACTG